MANTNYSIFQTNNIITRKYCSPAVITTNILSQIKQTALNSKMLNGINISTDNNTSFAEVEDSAVTNTKQEYTENGDNDDNPDSNEIE